MSLIGRYAKAGKLTYDPLDESVPVHRGVSGDRSDLVYGAGTRSRTRGARMVHEVATCQALQKQLLCKEIWVVGAEHWRNPDEDLPADFERRRSENYGELRKPLDPAAFIGSTIR